MKNNECRKQQCLNKDKYTFFHAYIIGYHPDPGGTLTVRTREINLKYDVFRPYPGADVTIPSGVVYNFEGNYKKRGFKDGRHTVGVLTEFFERNNTLHNSYDVEGTLAACNETRDEDLFPASCFVV